MITFTTTSENLKILERQLRILLINNVYKDIDDVNRISNEEHQILSNLWVQISEKFNN